MSSLRLVDTDTGEVEVLMDADEARALTTRIYQAVEDVAELIAEAYTRGAWKALGYDDWDAYKVAEFGTARLSLPAEDRTEQVASLTEQGYSTRAIAEALGVDRKTVMKDQTQVVESGPPEQDAERRRDEVEPRFGNKIRGADGKTYTRPEPKPAEPVRLRSDEEQAAYEAEQEHLQHVRILTSALEQLVNGWIYLPKLPANPLRDEALEALNDNDRKVVLEVEALYQEATR